MRWKWSVALSWGAGFALLNVAMYLALRNFWIGGSSFLPMIGQLGPGNKFLLPFVVNVGVVTGAFLSAMAEGTFRVRTPRKTDWPVAVGGGFLIGMGITLAPGTCTTAFVTGMPMLSVASFLSAAGIVIGAYIVYRSRGGR